MSSTLLLLAVEIRDGEVVGLSADERDPTVAAHPAAMLAPSAPRPLLRFPKANVLRAAVARLVTAAREDTRPCTPS